MTRTHWILGGTLLLQLVLIAAVRSPFSDAAHGAAPEALLPGLEAITAAKIELLGGEEDDASVTLTRDEGLWRVDSLEGFPADGTKVDNLIHSLEDLRVRRPVVSSNRYHEAFNVEEGENEGRVRVWGAGEDSPEVDLIIGDSPNYRLTHVRKFDDDRVFEAQGLASYDLRARASDWIDKKLLDAQEFQVVGLSLTNGIGSFDLEKEAGVWRVRGDDGTAFALDPQKVGGLVRAATALRLTEGVGVKQSAAHGFDEPAATVVLRWNETGEGAGGGESAANTQEITLYVGGVVTDDDSQRYITRDGFEYTGTIWESSVKLLLDESVNGLAQAS